MCPWDWDDPPEFRVFTSANTMENNDYLSLKITSSQ